jgi:hypothetical protein
MKIIANKYKKVADFCYELFRIAELKLYASKFSNKLYSHYQHLFLLVYKQHRKFTYEDLLTDLASNAEMKAYLGLKNLPHYTTLIKFAQRLPNAILDRLVLAFEKLIPQPEKVAIDATGISLDNASLHYCKRLGIPYQKRPFMKTSFIVDIENYFILLVKTRKKSRHDVMDAKPMLEKLAKHYRPRVLYADRGYDANLLFKLCFEKLKAYPLILQKRLDVPKRRRHGTYRKLTYDHFDYGEYLQRNKIETLNSMIKKRFGSNVKSKSIKLQKFEIITRVIAFNIDRLIRTGKNVILIFIRITRVSY